jgi:Ala-tRNA(Pro) deacylase
MNPAGGRISAREGREEGFLHGFRGPCQALKEVLMNIPSRLEKYLAEKHVPYTRGTHRLAYSAQGVAAAQHVGGWSVAKTVILKSEEQFLMVVLPAPMKVDLHLLREQLPFKDLELADEWEFGRLFPDCQLGAMAPFGNLYGLPVYVEESLARQDEIVFNAGTHVDTIRMKYKDFEQLVCPTVIHAAAMSARN